MDQNSRTFFSNLKHVCRTVEQGVQEVQKEAEAASSSTGYSVALNKLIHLSKKAQEMKLIGREKTEKLKEDGEKFDELLSLCHSLLDIQRNKLNQIESYFQQYGYEMNQSSPKKESTDKDNGSDDGDDDDDNIESLKNTSEEVCTPPQTTNKPKDISKTPRLEDFGLSRLTMNALARGQKNNAIDNSKLIQKRLDNSSIPAIFHHDGLTVTPSLMGGKSLPFMTPDKSVFEQNGSPLLKTTSNLNEGGKNYAEMEDKSQGTKLRLETLLTDSPQPPTFLTPAFKKMKMKNTAQEKKETTMTYLTDSPVPPAFITPLLKQLVHSQSSDNCQNSKSLPVPTSEQQQSTWCKTAEDTTSTLSAKKPGYLNFTSTGTPEPPELTISLSAYADITGVHRLPVTPETTRTIKCNNTTSATHSGNKHSKLSSAPFYLNKVQHAGKETPPAPNLSTFYRKGEGTLPEAPTLSSTSYGNSNVGKKSYQQSSSFLSREPEPPQLSQKETLNEPKPFQFLCERLVHNSKSNVTPEKPDLLLEKTTISKTTTAVTNSGNPPIIKNLACYNTDMPQPPKFLRKYNFTGDENVPPHN